MVVVKTRMQVLDRSARLIWTVGGLKLLMTTMTLITIVDKRLKTIDDIGSNYDNDHNDEQQS